MPVIIPPDKYSLWLDPAQRDSTKLAGLLRPFDSSEMASYPVSTFVNNAKHDSAQCIERR
jgi:putative SOS response-associated peptidase YedK